MEPAEEKEAEKGKDSEFDTVEHGEGRVEAGHADKVKKREKKAQKDKALAEVMDKFVSTEDEGRRKKKGKHGKKAAKEEEKKEEAKPAEEEEEKKRKGKGKKGKKHEEEEETETKEVKKEEPAKAKKGKKKDPEAEEPKESKEAKEEEKKPAKGGKKEEDEEEEKGKDEAGNLRVRDSRMPVEVLYCGVCGRPVEYCEFSPEHNKCKAWLYKASPALYAKMFGTEAPKIEETKKTGEEEKGGMNLRVLANVGKKKTKKKVTIQDDKKIMVSRVNRGKSNYLTQIYGLHFFGTRIARHT